MTALTPGANTPLSAVRAVVDVTAPVAVDVSALLLTADGKARSDADLVSSHQPTAPGVTHRPGGQGVGDAVAVDTAAVPPEIEKVVVAASLHAPGTTFAGAEPTATVRDADTGTVLATFTPPRLGSETALLLVEVYRRAGGWKIRAVGQGYANGLAGIAADFGVTVAAPTPRAVTPDAPPPPPAAAPSAATAPPSAPPSPPAPSPSAPAADSGRITLDKGRVTLAKRQTVSLTKGGRPLLGTVRMGLGWEPAYGSGAIDLDASVIAFDAQRKKLATCFFLRLSLFDGAVRHSGDNLTGAGAGDDETITVNLAALPAKVHGLVFTVNSFSGHKFTKVAKAYCRLVDVGTEQELVRFDLTDSEPRTAVLMCKLVRQSSGAWEMTALGEFHRARTARGLVKPAAAAL